MRVRAPAKLNLFLRVVGRRPDGFHELETVFQAIDLADELTVASSDELRMTGGCDAAPAGTENLVMRAAAALRQASGYTGGAEIHLEKRIPVGAGLGGGSSDAAAALVALSQLWRLGFSYSQLAALALELGSDVPFFLQGGMAIGRGRGEILEPMPPVPLWFALVRPPFPVPTPRAFALYRPPGGDAPSLDEFRSALATADPVRIAPLLHNDLETGVFAEWPELERLRTALLAAGALGARMTGSGSVLFGLARDRAHAEQIARHVHRPDLWVCTANAIQESADA